MARFDVWYEQHKTAIHSLKERKEVAYYVWNNKPVASQRTSTKSNDSFSADFESFWCDYPNKTGKGAAWITWQKLKPPIIGCLETLAWQRKTQHWTNENGKYIPHPTTWINQRRWLDEAPRSASESEGEWYVDMNGCRRQRS
jgi:hypothetical protein